MANQKKEFGKIYDQYIEKIYRFVFLKVNSQDIAQDICSETFLKGWESFKEQKIDNPQAFLYRIARNLVIDHYREKGRTNIVSAEYTPIPDPRASFEEKIALNSELDQVKKALSNLNDDYQTVVVLRYLEDLPISEIAKALDKTEDTTRVTLHRALKALKKEVNKTA